MVDSEQVTTAYTCCRGKPSHVLDLSVRSLACTGPGDDTLGFWPIGPHGSRSCMDGFLLDEAEASVSAALSPRVLLGRRPLADHGDVAFALTGASACIDYWNSISRALPLPIKTEEEEKRVSKHVL